MINRRFEDRVSCPTQPRLRGTACRASKEDPRLLLETADMRVVKV
jgi:hypothetical protein